MKVAMLVLLLVVGCKKSGGDCASAAAHAIAVSKPVLSKLPGMESRYAAVTAEMKARCLEDRWTPEVIACVNAATSEPELGMCRDKMTSEQKDKMRAAMMDALGMGGGGGAGGGGATWPAACVDWDAMVTKAASCDKVPEAARASLNNTLDAAKRDWPTQPASRHADLTAACKASADAIRSSLGPTCGW